jgi:hypothetical protein
VCVRLMKLLLACIEGEKQRRLTSSLTYDFAAFEEFKRLRDAHVRCLGDLSSTRHSQNRKIRPQPVRPPRHFRSDDACIFKIKVLVDTVTLGMSSYSCGKIIAMPLFACFQRSMKP